MSKKPDGQGLIMTSPLHEPYQMVGVVIGEPGETPSDAIRNILAFNQDHNDGIINIKIINSDQGFYAYGDRIKLNPILH